VAFNSVGGADVSQDQAASLGHELSGGLTPASSRFFRIVLHPSQRMLSWGLLGLIVADAGSLMMLKKNPVIGTLGLALLTYVLGRFLFLLMCNPDYFDIVINDSGIVSGSIGKGRSIAWADVTGIRTGWPATEDLTIAWTRWVFVDYARDGKSDRARMCARFYGRDADELVSMISEAYERACGRPAPVSAK
jgi:hypothetical protein